MWRDALARVGWDKRVGKPVLLYARCGKGERLSCPLWVVWGALDGINGLENPFSFMLGVGKGEPTFLSVAGCLGLGGWDKRVGKPVLLYARCGGKENRLSCPLRVVWG